MINYAKTVLESFQSRPFSEVDSLILSWLSYLHLPNAISELTKENGVSLKEIFCSEYFEQMTKGVTSPKQTLELLSAAVASPRFRNLRLFNYKENVESENCCQFAAITYELSPKQHYIAFRGTDCSFIGWKEDFLLALNNPIPAQRKATDYLFEAARKFGGELYVGGHSKGGNLAVYAAAMCENSIQQRIKKVYTYDGPGFPPDTLKGDGFAETKNRIHKILPQSSLIGTIFEQECEPCIVESCNKGFEQHNPFSWTIRDGGFVYRDTLTADSRLAYKSINKWIAEMTEEERKQIIDAVFEILDSTGAADFDELGGDLKNNIPIIVKKAVSLDKERRSFLIRSVGKLAKDGVMCLSEIISKT